MTEKKIHTHLKDLKLNDYNIMEEIALSEKRMKDENERLWDAIYELREENKKLWNDLEAMK
jgi:hypothetical protein